MLNVVEKGDEVFIESAGGQLSLVVAMSVYVSECLLLVLLEVIVEIT